MISRNNKGGFKTASAAAACTFFIASPSQAASKSLFEATEVRGRQPRTSSAAHVTRTRFARLRADALPTAAAGTDPGDDASVLELTDIAFAPLGRCVVVWQSQPGKTYTLTHSTNSLATFEIYSSGIAATPPLNVCTVSVGTVRSCFIRVAVETP